MFSRNSEKSHIVSRILKGGIPSAVMKATLMQVLGKVQSGTSNHRLSFQTELLWQKESRRNTLAGFPGLPSSRGSWPLACWGLRLRQAPSWQEQAALLAASMETRSDWQQAPALKEPPASRKPSTLPFSFGLIKFTAWRWDMQSWWLWGKQTLPMCPVWFCTSRCPSLGLSFLLKNVMWQATDC